jgi:hypothetical protein
MHSAPLTTEFDGEILAQFQKLNAWGNFPTLALDGSA